MTRELGTFYNFGIVRLAEGDGHWYIMYRNHRVEICDDSALKVAKCINWGARWWEEVTPEELAAIRAMMPHATELGV